MCFGAAANTVRMALPEPQEASLSKAVTSVFMFLAAYCFTIGGTWLILESHVLTGGMYMAGGFLMFVGGPLYYYWKGNQE